MPAVGGIHSANGGTKARSLFYGASEVESVHSGGSFPFLHGGRVSLITLRGAGVALRVNKIGFACKGNRLLQRGPSYIGRSMVAVD